MVEVFAAVDSNVDFDGEEAVVVVTEVNVGLEAAILGRWKKLMKTIWFLSPKSERKK